MSDPARWELPVVVGRVAGKCPRPVTAEELDDIARAAWDEGHAKGHADGLAAAAAETQRRHAALDARIARLDDLMALLARPLAELDAEVESQLAQLALTVAGHLVRRELRIDRTQVIGILRHVVSLLPAAARDVRVHLHPDDAALVNEKLATPASERAWIVVEDPVMARGGCRVTAGTSQIDARLETRLKAAIVEVLGEERHGGERESA